MLRSLATALFLFLGLSMSQARVIEHELGVTDVPDAPKRIVVLEFSFIDALASVGVAPVGIADDNKRGRVVPAYTNVIGDNWVSVGTRKSPSLEVIASLNPDLIIADKKRHSKAFKMLSEIAPTIVLDSLAGDYHASVSQMSIIGKAIGKADAMEKRVKEHKDLMAAYVAKIAPKANGKTAQFGVSNAKGLWLHSPASYNGSLLKMFGFGNGMKPDNGDKFSKTYVPTTLEQLSEVNPDLLLFGKYADPAFVDGWADDQLYKDLTAVKNKQVHTVTAHNWSRLRGMLAAELTAADLLKIVE